MKNKDLIKALKKYPRDTNICIGINKDSNFYTFINDLFEIGNEIYIIGPGVKEEYYEEEKRRKSFERDNFHVDKVYVRKQIEGEDKKPLLQRLELMLKLVEHNDGRFKGLDVEGNIRSSGYSFYEEATASEAEVFEYMLEQHQKGL